MERVRQFVGVRQYELVNKLKRSDVHITGFWPACACCVHTCRGSKDELSMISDALPPPSDLPQLQGRSPHCVAI